MSIKAVIKPWNKSWHQFVELPAIPKANDIITLTLTAGEWNRSQEKQCNLPANDLITRSVRVNDVEWDVTNPVNASIIIHLYN